MDKWTRQDINNSKFRELCENFYYYKRKMGYGPAAIEEYDASVFICIFNDKEQLINNWKKINYFIAFHVQKNIEKIIEKSNFYICLFVNESIGNEEKSRIQGNSFCAKKYIFEEKLMSEKAYLERVEARIFSLGIEKIVGETFKINQIELQNFRKYEGNLKVDLTGKNEKASAFTLIYAKNGYGKTSIFDGLEYVFKGEVDRIVDLLNNNKNQPLKGAIYHNKNCAHRAAYSQIELSLIWRTRSNIPTKVLTSFAKSWKKLQSTIRLLRIWIKEDIRKKKYRISWKSVVTGSRSVLTVLKHTMKPEMIFRKICCGY